jgi:Fic family protein
MNAAVETGDDPFEDGNGRIGRAIAEKALAQSLRYSPLTTLPPFLPSGRPIYDALKANNKVNDITSWLAWLAATAIEAV